MPEPAPLVAVEGLGKSFGGRPVLAGLGFSLAPGGIHGFVGANGGGKTTALRMLAGILAPDAGGGQILGWDLRRRRAEIRQQVGYMSQRLSLYADLPVRENLLFRARVYGVPDARAAVQATLRDFGLADVAEAPAGRLSGGWARRLQLAAALVHAPRLLLLDEPTAGLDALARQDVWRRIGRLAAEGAGVVVCTHDLAEAERCASASFFAEGRILASGSPQAIARSAGARAWLLHGRDADHLGPRVDALAGIIASHPQGGSLRVVAEPATESPLQRLAAERGLSLADAELRLEDAALAFAARREARP